MSLYPVPVRTLPCLPMPLAADICHTLTFQQLFGFLPFVTRLMALTYKLLDKILVDFHHDIDLEFSRSSMGFAMSQLDMV